MEYAVLLLLLPLLTNMCHIYVATWMHKSNAIATQIVAALKKVEYTVGRPVAKEGLKGFR